MNTLFPLEPSTPEGFLYFDNFISEAEEKDLLHVISQTELHTFIFQGFEAKRKVASFGYDWSFERKTLSKGKEIPIQFEPIINKVAAHLSVKATAFAELLVLAYPVGAVINWHRDAPPFDLIAGLSLQSDCTFRFRPVDIKKQTRAHIISIPVKRRSLYVMQGPSRSEWQHSISPVKHERYSITLRTLAKF
jgi:alkylated DNA repair dioxygenase AlkB